MECYKSPVRLNALKHHFRYLQSRIVQWKESGWDEVAASLQELGSNQFDIYTGSLEVNEIRKQLEVRLLSSGIDSGSALRRWLGRQGYKSVVLSDGSRWVIRESESEEDYAHVHPCRHQPLVKRIRANHLKTAVALLHANPGSQQQTTDYSTGEVNAIRKDRLGLSPVKSLEDSRKITETIAFLNNSNC